MRHALEHVNVQIDETWRDDSIARVDDLASVARRKVLANGGNPTIGEGNVGPAVDPLRWIDERATGDQQIKHGLFLPYDLAPREISIAYVVSHRCQQRRNRMASVLESFRLNGQVALVTGAGSGLGAAFSLALAEAGADVACVDLSLETAEVTAGQLRELGRRAVAIRADVAVEADVVAMVQVAVERLGGLDVAFANAGIAEAAQPLVESSLEDWRKVIDVDLTSVYLTAREVAKVMIPRRRGKIVNTASIYGLVASFIPGRGRAYAAAKAGVVNLTRSLAIELAPHNIQVNAIAPTFIQTNIAGGVWRGETEASRALVVEASRRTPIGRIGRPEELKGIAVFLASTASDLMTGTTVPVDGGYLAW
jgi:NAD(P)-dependent dehydrogenase (short-subunit alcohol dehydrogenase family)